MNNAATQHAAGRRMRDSEVSFWYRPWFYAHASRTSAAAQPWLDLSAADELAQRLQYPAWCGLFSLPEHPEAYDGSAWWQIASLDTTVFERANYLAGLVLLLAKNRRDSFALVRSAGASASQSGDLRWVLQNASLVPQAVIDLDGWDGIDDPALCGYLALQFACRKAAPSLAQRIALRYARGAEEHAALACASARDAEHCVRYLQRLWSVAAVRGGAHPHFSMEQDNGQPG
jgi:hypothetical protein